MGLLDQNWENFPFTLSDKDSDLIKKMVGQEYEQYESLFFVALTHQSFINEHKDELAKYGIDNPFLEKLEDLGKEFIELALARIGYNSGLKNPHELSEIIVSTKPILYKTFNEYLSVLDGEYKGKGLQIELNNPEYQKANIKVKNKIISQLIGIFFILLGYEKTYSIISNLIPNNSQLSKTDYKTEAQNFVQSKKLPTPIYVTLEEKGPDHLKEFLIEQ